MFVKHYEEVARKFGHHIDKSLIFSSIDGLVYDSHFVDEFEESRKGWSISLTSMIMIGCQTCTRIEVIEYLAFWRPFSG